MRIPVLRSWLWVLVGCALFCGRPPSIAAAQSTPSAQQGPDPARSRSFAGAIFRDGDRYFLRDESGKSLKVSDPARVRQYEGKQVKITGRLSADNTTIYIDSIQPASSK